MAQALEHGARIEGSVAAPELLAHPFGQKLLRRLCEAGAPPLLVTADVFRRLSLAVAPQGIGVVARQPGRGCGRSALREPLLGVPRVDPQSRKPGTIVRTCDAVGAAGLILIGDTVDPYDPGAIRVHHGRRFHAALRAGRELRGVRRLEGKTPPAAGRHLAVRRDRLPRRLLPSSRGPLHRAASRKGMTPEQADLCDVLVRISMVGASDSLNVAVATGVMLYEIFNQRHSERQTHRRRGNSRESTEATRGRGSDAKARR